MHLAVARRAEGFAAAIARHGEARVDRRGLTGEGLAALVHMSNRAYRPQKADQVPPDDTRPLVVKPLANVDDRLHNPKDIEVDTAAIRNGIEHGGTTESHAETRAARGTGGRKRSGAGRHRVGRAVSKRR